MNRIRFLWLGFLGLFNAENGRQKIFEKKNSSKKYGSLCYKKKTAPQLKLALIFGLN